METSISIDAKWTSIKALLLPKSSSTVKRRWNGSSDIPTTLTPASIKNGEIKSLMAIDQRSKNILTPLMFNKSRDIIQC